MEGAPLALGPVKVVTCRDANHQNKEVEGPQSTRLQLHLVSSVTPEREEEAGAELRSRRLRTEILPLCHEHAGRLYFDLSQLLDRLTQHATTDRK